MSQDKELQESVMVELGGEPSINAEHIGVAANAGVVTLTGHVQSFPQKVAAERAAARVEGVRALSEQRQVVCVGLSTPRPKRRLGREGAPLGQRGGAPLFVNLAGDEMALLIE